MARYLQTGVHDPVFGTNGIVVPDIPGPDEYAGDVAIEATGKIVITGFSGDLLTQSSLVTLRLDAEGEMDDSFGTRV